MYRVCIALVDAARARFFTYDRTADEAGVHDDLVEHTDLVNPGRRQTGSAHTGRLSEHDGAFARTAMATLRELIDDYPAKHVILCAAPRMLGNLRACVAGILPDDITLHEVPRDLCTLAPAVIRTHLADQGLLPVRSAVDDTRRIALAAP